MSAKSELIKPHLLRSIDRLKRFIELDAPRPIIGSELWIAFRAALATYGPEVGMPVMTSLYDAACAGRGICSWKDCVNEVDRPGVYICETCAKAIGITDEEYDDVTS
jgi:hypothetical protein